jgi:glycosyltransferase involved in cell wall biosynthesis
VYLSIGLVDRLLRGGLHPRLARRYQELATRAEVIFAFAPLEVEQLSDWVGSERVRLMPLGIDTEWWHGGMPNAAERSDVLAFGRDESRDFGALDAAMRTLPAEAVVVGALARRQGLQARPGLLLLDEVSISRLRGLIQAARVVVVPAKPAAHGAGQTSALNAMAAGRPVVMSDTGWAAAAGLRPGFHYLDVPPSDAEALAVAIGRLLADPGEAEAIGRRAHEHVRSRLSTEAQADALLAALPPQQ